MHERTAPIVTEQDVQAVLAEPSDREAALERVRRILERALNYRHCVQTLHDSLDVPDEVVAHVAGVVVGSVRRWRSNDPGVGEPRLVQAQAIERLRRIALVLVSSGTFYDLRGVGVWLQTGLETLGWRAPYEILAEAHGFAAVLEEAKRFVRPGAGSAAFGPPRPELMSTRTRQTARSAKLARAAG